MIITSKVEYPKKRYKLKYPKETMLEMLVKEKSKKKEETGLKPYDFIIYTDGGFSKHCHIGSWSYLIKVKYDKKRFKLHKSSGVTTSAVSSTILMELNAVIEAAKFIKNKSIQKKLGFTINTITVYSDNKQVVYSRSMFRKYSDNNWTFLKSEKTVNEELKKAWIELNELNTELNISYKWIKSHNGNVGNEFVDEMCNTRIKKQAHTQAIIKHNIRVLRGNR
jgi:ribonuclease HI